MKPATVSAVTHLNFRGQAREALDFYQSVFGGQVNALTYKDFNQVTNEAEADQLIWGQVMADTGFRVMAYDVPSNTPWNPGENAFMIVLEAKTQDEIRAYWDKLSDGATVISGLQPAQWTPLFGVLKDRFGTPWTLSVAAA
ncbi:MAG TPA: VOC family protein [Duganella sp.]|nr:VOC family protein [Duganella sp.]